MQEEVDVTRTAAPGRPVDSQRPFRNGDLVAGRFRIVREIAEGGMGIVYEAIDDKLAERRALKCAKAGFASRLSPEARTSLRVTHPNVCRVFEIHSTDTPLGVVDFLTMEYIDGGTLSKALRTRGGLPEPEARAIALQICAGVAAAHAQDLLHRDLKSSNVLLTRDARGARRAVVTDFGLAQESSATDQASASSGIAGTPEYLAPERRTGAAATVASDVFALGVVLHELVTGARPDETAGTVTLLPAVPTRWRPIVARCLDPDPARRFVTVAQVGDALADKGRWKRVAAWTTAALVPIGIAVWQILFPAPLAARLAILPIESGTNDAPAAAFVRGASSELSARLTRLRPRPPQLVIIPVEETRGVSRDDVGRAKDRLGASHVLQATVTRQGVQLVLRGAIVDTSTKLTLSERTGTYPANDPGAVSSALFALVASTFRLPRQTTAEGIAPGAYSAYAEGLAALRSGAASYAQAVAAFEKAISLDPRSVLPRAGLAEACYNGWVSTANATWLARGSDELSKAERLNSDSLAVRLAAGRLHLVPGSYDRALQEYQRAAQLDPTNPEAWSGLGRAFELAGRQAEAVAAFDEAIELQPGYFRPINDLGGFYRQLGNVGEAEKQWRRVTALVPERIEGHSNLGALYADDGRYTEAEAELRRALELEPRSRPVLNNLGALYQYMGRDDDAVRFLEQARAVGPDTNILLLNLGDSYRRLRRQTDAAAAYGRAREITEPVLLADPRDAAARAFIAYFALRLGDQPTAERELAQALSLAKDNRAVLRRAAICYEAMGDRERALSVLQSAPPDVMRELSRQPDLSALRSDPRFTALLPKSDPR